MSPLSRLLLCACMAAAWLLGGCGRLPPPDESGELVIGVREAAGFFQRDKSDEATTFSGADHDLGVALAERLGLRPRFVVAGGPAELADLVARQRVHLAAGVPVGAGGYVASAPVWRVGMVIAGTVDSLGPDKLDELPEHTVRVIAGSPLAAALRALPQPPPVEETAHADEAALLASVAASHGALAAVHQVHLDLALNFHPDLRPLLRLPGEVPLGWALAEPGAAALKENVDAFIAESQRDGTLPRIHDRYFGHLKRITAEGVAQFIDDIRQTLPNYRSEFQRAEETTGLDWRLLAALAYQESKWDPLATSYTGVRGLMMLTEDTADHLRVKNRLDPAESIRAGSRYLLDLVEQVPESVPYPDRLWLGLAAYNLGMGHLRGGFAIARMLKRDPDSWYEMKQVLPQLARPEIYARLKSGRARGGEAVIMVENIRTYFDILARFEAPHATPFPKPLARGFRPG